MLLTSLKVEKVNSQVPTGWNFKAYSIASGGRWYNLRGKSEKFYENLKEGQMLDGLVAKKPYTSKDGEQKVSYEFHIVDKAMATVLGTVDELEGRIKVLEEAVFKAESTDVPDDDVPPIDDEDLIGF